MLDFSPEKMLFVFLIVMVLLGPEKLPEISRKIGKVMGELKKVSGGFREEMHKAVNDMTNDSGTSPSPPTDANASDVSKESGGSGARELPSATGPADDAPEN